MISILTKAELELGLYGEDLRPEQVVQKDLQAQQLHTGEGGRGGTGGWTAAHKCP